MDKQELLKTAKPITFKAEMVQAILNGRKTVTRRLLKENTTDVSVDQFIRILQNYKYKKGDIIWVKENKHQCKKDTRIFLAVKEVSLGTLSMMTEGKAAREGFDNLSDFLNCFFEIYRNANYDSLVWVIEFERMGVDA